MTRISPAAGKLSRAENPPHTEAWLLPQGGRARLGHRGAEACVSPQFDDAATCEPQNRPPHS